VTGLMVLAVATVLLADQVSKRAIEGWLSENQVGWRRSLLSIKRVTAVAPTSRSTWPRCGLVGLWAVAVLGAVLYAGVVTPPRVALAELGLGCAIGGATSNLLDRLWRGGIVDFIGIGFWPTFNLADAAIVGGVLLAVCAAG
jgi:signal peptidase II